MVSDYESKKLLSEYLLFHYGSAKELLPYEFGPKEALEFPKRVALSATELSEFSPGGRALDVGCAVGRSSFELSNFFEEVLGLDYSENFIEAASKLASGEELQFEYTVEGELKEKGLALAPKNSNPGRVSFRAADACKLPGDLGAFDFVLAANLICRLPEPEKFLARLPELVLPGGMLVIASPYTWLEAHTPKANWLGGFHGEAGEVRSLEALKERLMGNFQFIRNQNLPFLIREHARKFQWSVSEVSFWRRIVS